MGFVALHIHSGFTFLGSALKANELPLLAKKLGYSAIGLSDELSCSGYAPFCHAAKENGIKPIYGFDLPLEKYVLSFFVLNETGYRNLLMINGSYQEGDFSPSIFKDHNEGLALVISPTPELFGKLNEDDVQPFAEELSKISKCFVDSYIGLPYYPNNVEYVDALREFVDKYSYSKMAFPLIRYKVKKDAIALEILKAIKEKDNGLAIKEKEGNECFLSNEELSSFYSEEEIEATSLLADKSSFELISKRGNLLHFENNLGLSSSEYLRKLTYEGLHKKIENPSKTYLDRLEYELGIIDQMGYSDYFLIVSDYVNYAKTHGISVGPGRGSGAGSLVSYSLDIVSLDPIKYGLIFERFLNPGRQSMPDIDVDFADNERDRLVSYIEKRYGKERVAHVLATQNILAKQSLRDVGRIYGYDDKNDVSPLADSLLYPNESLRYNYKNSPKFKELVDKDPYYLELVSLASKIEGLPRQSSLHAAGVVINDTPLKGCLPISVDGAEGLVADLEKDYLEEQGFLKMDILGLRNLSIIDTCLRKIKENEGKELTHDELPYDDKKAIETIKSTKTMGLFQLEQYGMRKAIKEVEPSSFEEVAALLALYRPGPMDSIPSFARRKKGLEKVTYISPELEPILKETYGIIVYQEQIMEIVRAIASFSYSEADLFRRAISKKNESKLASLKDDLIKGALKNGKDRKTAETIFELIHRFANYGFNKAHAYSYAVISCRMAYLKTYYPKEFFSSILQFMSPGDHKFASTLSELKELGISIACPDINISTDGYEIDKDSIRFPLSSIKGLQGNLARGIQEEREENGLYKDIFDFAARTKRYGMSQTNLVKYIDAGALDSLCPSRASLRASSYDAIKYAEMLFGDDGDSILLELGIAKPEMKMMKDDKLSDLEAEKEVLGMMVSGSPLSLHKEAIEEKKAKTLTELSESNNELTVACIIKSVRAIKTKSGKKMAFMEAYDDLMEMSFVIFSEVYNSCYPLLKNDSLVFLRAHKDVRKEGSYIVDGVEPIR